MPRLFVGTFLSAEGIERVAKLSQDNAHLADIWRAKIRWTHRYKLHLTWVFLGDVYEHAIPHVISGLKDAMDSISLEEKPLALSYDRIEVWPNERKARLAVLTPHSTPDDVFKLDDAIKGAVAKFISPEQKQHEFKTFRPHITLLRFSDGQRRSGAGASSESEGDLKQLEGNYKARVSDFVVKESMFPIAHEIDEVHLIQSTFAANSHKYESLAKFTLG